MEQVPGGKENPIFRLTTKSGDNHTDDYLKNIFNNGFSKWKLDLFTQFGNAIKQIEK
jgi:hypothetical protein